jgi:hypothetical protein
MHINGACHCGAITFEADIDPARVLACHCTDCQTLSGAPFRAVVTVPIERFSVSGTPKAYIKVADSGNRRAQMFCAACGSSRHCGLSSHASPPMRYSPPPAATWSTSARTAA